jgi:hypothetical protein
MLMRPSSTNAARTFRPHWPFAAAASMLLTLILVGCAQIVQRSEDLARQAQELACINRCQGVKDQCDNDARFDFHQCQAGYRDAQRTFRWCNASNDEVCGYPWWSCSENLYGYCTNRFWECRNACTRARYPHSQRY